MELEKMFSGVVYTYMKNQKPEPKSYKEAIPLVRPWINTQKEAYSLVIPEKHAALTEAPAAKPKAQPPSAEKQLEKHLMARQPRVTSVAKVSSSPRILSATCQWSG